MKPDEVLKVVGDIYSIITDKTTDFQEMRAIIEMVTALINRNNRADILKELKEFTEAAKKQEPGAK